jgi:3-(3-hydroxy-phenyl)propionate hydroxylase
VPHDVAVVGAGPTGLTLANLLGAAGLRVLLVERNDTTVNEPRAVSIDDEALRTMQAAGLVEEVIADVELDYGTHYFTANGVCFAKVEPATREFGYPRRNAFSQPRLEATLRRGLTRFANVTTCFAQTCERVAEEADHVSLVVRGADAPSRTERAAYLVGCDGAHSDVRRAIGAKLEGSTYEQRWLIVDLAATNERFRHTRVSCDPARPMITLPGPHGIRRYEFMLRAGESDEQATAPEFVRRLLAAQGPDADARVVRRRVYTFHARIADRWHTARIYLAGDAAHLSPPFAGQGMNSGIRDAHNLAWKLAAVVRGELGPGVLATYQRERAPHALALIQFAVNLGRVMVPTSKRQAFLVQHAFRLARVFPALHRYFAEMKYKPKPHYREGFLAGGSGRRLVGRMLPQPVLGFPDGRRALLDDAIGSRFAVIALGPNAIAHASAVDRAALGLGDAVVVVAIVARHVMPDPQAKPGIVAAKDVEDRLAGMAARGADTLLLVRPDRYVAVAQEVRRIDDVRAFVASCRAIVEATWNPYTF